MHRLLSSSTQLLIFLAFIALARAIYYIDDANSTIQYQAGTIEFTQNPENYTFMANTSFFNHTVTQISCTALDEACHLKIPFTGSGITIYYVLLYLNASFTIDGGSSTFNNSNETYGYPSTSCKKEPRICHSTQVYDTQSLMYGNHVLDISPLRWYNASSGLSLYSSFIFDYAAVNDTNAYPTNNTSPSHRSRKTAATVGGSIAGVAIIAAIVLSVLWNRRRVRRLSQMEVNTDPPLTADVSQPLKPMWSPESFLPTAIAAHNRSTGTPPPVVPMFVDDLPNAHRVHTTPIADSITPRPLAIQTPTLPGQSSLPRPSTANVPLTVEELDFIRNLGSANVSAADIAPLIERMKAQRVAPVGDSSGGIGFVDSNAPDTLPPSYDFHSF